jgi:hypothetical protein
MPVSKQAWPNSEACWSPAIPEIGVPTGSPPTLGDGTEASRRCQDLGQAGARHPEQLAELVAPVAGAQVVEHRAAGVGVVGGVHRPAGQVPQQPGIDRAHGHVSGGFHTALGEDPLELRRRKVRVGHQAGPVPDQLEMALLDQLFAAVCGSSVLPHDRAVQRLAGAAAPSDDRLALVGDPHCDHRLVELVDQLAQDLADRLGDLGGVVLHPARLGKMLGELPVGQSDGVGGRIDGQCPHPGGPGIDGDDYGHATDRSGPLWHTGRMDDMDCGR